MNKKCTKCKVEKPTSEFSKSKPKKDGLESNCKSCKKAYRDANKAKLSAHKKSWYKDNKNKVLAGQKLYREANKDTVLAQQKAWKKDNPENGRFHGAQYRAAKLQRTPAWTETREIAWFYEHCPEGMQVDHKYPLQGETVSGLHCLANLQYLSAWDNISKNNRV
jgi:hypothetical protein